MVPNSRTLSERKSTAPVPPPSSMSSTSSPASTGPMVALDSFIRLSRYPSWWRVSSEPNRPPL